MRFLITYSIEIFYFQIYHEDFYGLSNNVLHVLGTRLFLYVLATFVENVVIAIANVVENVIIATTTIVLTDLMTLAKWGQMLSLYNQA